MPLVFDFNPTNFQLQGPSYPSLACILQFFQFTFECYEYIALLPTIHAFLLFLMDRDIFVAQGAHSFTCLFLV